MPTWVGIDIGSTSVKAAVVRATYRRLALIRLAVAEIGAAGDVREAIVAAMRDAMEGEAQGVDAVAAAIDGSRAAIHRLLLPATAQKQLADVLTYELEAQVPFDLSGAVFDWRVVELAGDRAAGQEEQLPIVAAVARTEDVRARIELVKEATGLEPERVGVGALALGALVPFVPALSEEDTVAVVDLGARASEVLVLERGEAIFARTLSVGTEGLPATAARLARDIRVSIAAHRAQGGAAPTRVYLCGGGAFASGAEGFLSAELEIPVQVLPDPVVGAEGPRGAARHAKAVALALSLAGRGAGLNLRRGELAYEGGYGWLRERIPVLAGLAAVILVSFAFSALARLHAAHKEQEVLEEALGAVTKEVLGTEATGAQHAQDLLAKQTALTDEDPMPHADAFDVMVQLSKAVPTTMTHDVEELEFQKGHVILRGVVGSIPDAQAIASTLGENKCFKDVKIKNTTQQVGSDRQKYLLEMDVKCPADSHAAAKKKGESAGGGK
jgi:general secretion pathway protein L